jgi:hypothetical protein
MVNLARARWRAWVGAGNGDFSREKKQKHTAQQGCSNASVQYSPLGTVMASDWAATRIRSLIEKTALGGTLEAQEAYKMCDKVGLPVLPCARLLSIRQLPTCSSSKPWRESLVSAMEHVPYRECVPEAGNGRKVIINVCIMYS